uniref:Uncharacterized protein n=1 Tax=Cannabis sativa TaxID=3483 RepID=A0A803QHR0_CANSA
MEKRPLGTEKIIPFHLCKKMRDKSKLAKSLRHNKELQEPAQGCGYQPPVSRDPYPPRRRRGRPRREHAPMNNLTRKGDHQPLPNVGIHVKHAQETHVPIHGGGHEAHETQVVPLRPIRENNDMSGEEMREQPTLIRAPPSPIRKTNTYRNGGSNISEKFGVKFPTTYGNGILTIGYDIIVTQEFSLSLKFKKLGIQVLGDGPMTRSRGYLKGGATNGTDDLVGNATIATKGNKLDQPKPNGEAAVGEGPADVETSCEGAAVAFSKTFRNGATVAEEGYLAGGGGMAFSSKGNAHVNHYKNYETAS